VRALKLAGYPPLRHDVDPVAKREDLGQLGGDEQDRLPLLGEFEHDLVDLQFRADVDAAGRLVEDENLRVAQHPFGEHDLLLVAAAQRLDPGRERRRLDAHAGADRRHEVVFRRPVEKAAVDEPSQRREPDVLLDVADRHEAVSLAVFGQHRHTELHAVFGAANGRGLAFDADGARCGGVEAEDRARDLRAARPHEPGKADDFSTADVKVHVAELFPVGQAGDFERRRSQAALRSRREHVLDRTADHQLNHAVDREVLRRPRRDMRSVANHGQVVGDAEEFVEPVRDVDDRRALGLELGDLGEQDLDLLGGDG
jgi:hypothetical protein